MLKFLKPHLASSILKPVFESKVFPIKDFSGKSAIAIQCSISGAPNALKFRMNSIIEIYFVF